MSWLLVLVLSAFGTVDRVEATFPTGIQVGDLPYTLELTAISANESAEIFAEVPVEGVISGGKPVEVVRFVAGKATLENIVMTDGGVFVGEDRAFEITARPRSIPGGLSVLPPVFAIILAVLLRQAAIALFAGIWLGALFIYGWNPLTALVRVIDTHVLEAVAGTDHAAIVLFTMALGGMVGIMAKSGATGALVQALSQRTRGRRSGMLIGWFSGIVIFFDDYANCLLVGNALRPFTDRLKVSREKLAYIVDSTAAPVTTVALVSTWVGYQAGLLDDLSGGHGYEIFLSSLPYSFYSFTTLAFVFANAATQRDFGPMLRAERRALQTGKVLRDGAMPLMDEEISDLTPRKTGANWWAAVIPIASVIGIVAVGLYITGSAAAGPDASMRQIIASSDSYAVLMWAGFGGSGIAAGFALLQRTLNLNDTFGAWLAGVKAMTLAVVILVLAWTIGSMCKTYLHTGPWVLSQFSPDPVWIPTMTFCVSAVIAIATGSSFSTMAIVVLVAMPMAWSHPEATETIRYATVAAILSGSVFGDHCSPISDTTIMSSMSCAADHVDHVRTQAPYALVCGLIAVVCGFIPAGFGVGPIVTIPLCLLAVAAVYVFVAKNTAE